VRLQKRAHHIPAERAKPNGAARRRRDIGLHAPRFSVNVSLRRLHDEGLSSGLRDSPIEPGAPSFEPLETSRLDERDDGFSRAVDRIKALAIDIEIDDFGAGCAVVIAEPPLQAASCRST
jgi:EAL domain-containing protein (putative c-di-GMP-specific phosphodiesterase class I)